MGMRVGVCVEWCGCEVVVSVSGCMCVDVCGWVWECVCVGMCVDRYVWSGVGVK